MVADAGQILDAAAADHHLGRPPAQVALRWVLDRPAITAAIHRLLSDPVRYAQLRENAHKAAQRFNWEAESRTLLEVYDEVRKG